MHQPANCHAVPAAGCGTRPHRDLCAGTAGPCALQSQAPCPEAVSMSITTGPGRLLGQERRPAVDARAGAAGTRVDLDGVCRWFGAGGTVVKAVDDVNLHVDEAAFV